MLLCYVIDSGLSTSLLLLATLIIMFYITLHYHLIPMFLTTIPVPTRWHPSPPHLHVSDYCPSTHEVHSSPHIHSDVTWQVHVIYCVICSLNKKNNLWDGFRDACDNSTVTNERNHHILSVQLTASHSPWMIVSLRSQPHTRHGTILLDLLTVLLAPNFQTLPSRT